MKLAIMQPYFFPYIGYFQLINIVDKFIFYDDVNFIKRGWINRNRILSNQKDLMFSIPLKNISQNKKINETEISNLHFDKWLSKFRKTLNNTYSKAPNYFKVIKLIEGVLDERQTKISMLAIKSVIKVCEYLEINTQFEVSSMIYSDSRDFNKADRLIDICKKNQARVYINPIGGLKIYSKEEFKKENIELKFISSKEIRYKQFNDIFVPNLSIIDVLMFNSKEKVKEMLNEYELI